MPDDPTVAAFHPEPSLVDFTREGARAELEQLGEAAWAVALDYLYDEALRRPVGPDDYPELRARFFSPSGGRPAPAPESPTCSADLLDEVRERLVPYLYNSQHPRSFSYFTPPPLVASIVGELLGQWFHQGVDVFHGGPIGAVVEEEVTTWLRRLVGFDDAGWGVLTSGGVMANIMAMTVARDRHLPRLVGMDRPPRGRDLERVRVYCSDQAHFSIGRALSVLGFPEETLVRCESDDRFRLQVAPVAEAIARDRAAGLVPLVVAAVCGSTNTGSTDDVVGLAELASAEGLWYHVDAAYGGAALLSPRDRQRVPGLEGADSVTIDPHKWFFQAYDIGALVVRSRLDLHATFSSRPEYYRSAIPETEPLDWYEYSIEGTRRFRALKLWLSWKHLGTEGLARLVEANNDVAAVLADELRAAPDFEAAVDRPELAIVCFRHVPGGVASPSLSGEELDAHQDRLQRALEVSGRAWVSTTRLRGRTYLRAGVVNYLSRPSDVRALLEAVRELAASLA